MMRTHRLVRGGLQTPAWWLYSHEAGVKPPCLHSGTRRLLGRAGVMALVVGLGLLLGSGPAWAHSRLESSDPVAGASLATGPQKVSLTFNEPVQPGFTVITVIGPDGADYRTGSVSEVDDTVGIGVRPLGPAGGYQIGYRVVSADGHPISGSIPFTLTTAGSGTGATAPPIAATAAPVVPAAAAPAGDGGAPVWPWIVGAVVVVAIGVGAALRLGQA
jgi:copper resistance protein C